MMTGLDTSASLLSLLSDATRVRLLSLLDGRELTVAELTEITQLSQSRVSTHLGRLRDAGLLRDRRAGASSYYRLAGASMPAEARALWTHLQTRLHDPVLEADHSRCDAMLRAREGTGWPDTIAGRMERHYSPGRTWESLARAFVGLLRFGDVLDVGAGDGTVAQLLAPQARSVTCIEQSARLVEAARERLAVSPAVTVVQGDMHALPFEGGSFDQVLMLNVLPYTSAPERALSEAARVMRGDGHLTVVTLAVHDHAAVTESYGHVNEGIAVERLESLLEDRGLVVESCAVTSRERRKPHFGVVTAHARKEMSP